MKKITLDSIIKDYFIEKDQNTEHGYGRALRLIINGAEDLYIDVSGVPTFLEVELNGEAHFSRPCNLLKTIGIHFPLDNGTWGSFARDGKLSKATNQTKGAGVKLGASTTVGSTDYSGTHNALHFRNGQNIGAYYNNNISNPFTFTENEAFDTIEVSSNAPATVIFEYLATPTDGDFEVHLYLKEPLLAWLRYADIRSKKNVSQNDVHVLRRAYTAAKAHLRKRMQNMTLDDFLNAVRSGNKQIYKL